MSDWIGHECGIAAIRLRKPLNYYIKNLMKNWVVSTQISNLSKKIYSIPKLVYGQKPNKTQHLERILQCGEVLLVVV